VKLTSLSKRDYRQNRPPHQFARDKINVGFELPVSISAPVVPNVPEMTVNQPEQVVA
jgi:hypothetical protein